MIFHLLHITCLKKSSSVFVLFEKLRNIFIRDIHKFWSGHFVPAKFDTRHLLKYNVQPDQSNQIITIYLIEPFNSEVLLYDIFSLQWNDIISLHCFMSRLNHAHWYPSFKSILLYVANSFILHLDRNCTDHHVVGLCFSLTTALSKNLFI